MDIKEDFKEPLSWEHREELMPLFREINEPLSEFCFPNLFLFRNTHHYQVVRREGEVFITGLSYDKKTFVLPLKNITEFPEYREKLLSLLNEVDFIYPVPCSWLYAFPGPQFCMNFNENDSDYLFSTEELSTYAGRKLAKKRNLKKQFLKGYNWRTHELTADLVPECLRLLSLWYENGEMDESEGDGEACKEALTRFDEMCLEGRVYEVDGEIKGFILGEGLTSDTYAYHFAKADISIKGLYQFMFSDYSEHIAERYAFTDMEQDLGEPGLRHTKRSYKPVSMGLKYRVALKPVETG